MLHFTGMDAFSGLNPDQKRAVLHTEGPLLVLAGAGAGKTKTITHRIQNLIKNGVAPAEILAITFTNKAAKEMRERVEKLLEGSSGINRPVSMFERPFISTFHALGVHIIKENSRLLELPRHFTIFDRNDSLSAIKTALKNINLDPKQYEPGRLLSVISREKGRGTSLSDFSPRDDRDFMGKILREVWSGYEEILKTERALDFDDLLLKTLLLLKSNEDVRERYENTWRYIHIDEYQDTNSVQYDIVKLLAQKYRNVCVVGDIDQSIYSWRGADFKNIMRFEKDYPNTEVILLEQNYRSTKTILKAANTIISKNTLRKEKKLFTENDEGEKISLYGSFDEEDEAYYVARQAKELVGKGVQPKEIAVLYRANFQSRILEEAMLKEKVPYQVLGIRFFERKEVKDVLSYLKAALDTDSLTDVKRIINIPPRGIGKTTVLKLFSGKKNELPESAQKKISDFYLILQKIKQVIENKKTSEAVLYAIMASGIKRALEEGSADDLERLENVAELVSLSQKYDFLPGKDGVEQLLTDAALASDQDDLKENINALKLMTVHASKGLEFEYVFITGLEEDLFPHQKPDGERKNTEESEEERRLFYVALTRAKKKLYLSYAAVRTIFGSKQVNIPSEFISDIDKELLEEITGEEEPRGRVIYLE